MKYLLTQEEIDDLTPVSRVSRRDSALEAARKIIVKLADIPCGKTYCSECPISAIGFYEHDDPEAINMEHSKLICKSYRSYSK